MLVYRQSLLPMLRVGNPLLQYITKIYLHDEVIPYRALAISPEVSGFYDFGIKDQRTDEAGILDKDKPCIGRVAIEGRSSFFNMEAIAVYTKTAAKLFRYIKSISVKDCQFGADCSVTDICYMDELAASHIFYNSTLVVVLPAKFDIAGECGSVVYSPLVFNEQRFGNLYDFLLAINSYCQINVFRYKTVKLLYSPGFCRVEDGVRCPSPAHLVTIKFIHNKDSNRFFTKISMLTGGSSSVTKE